MKYQPEELMLQWLQSGTWRFPRVWRSTAILQGQLNHPSWECRMRVNLQEKQIVTSLTKIETRKGRYLRMLQTTTLEERIFIMCSAYEETTTHRMHKRFQLWNFTCKSKRPKLQLMYLPQLEFMSFVDRTQVQDLGANYIADWTGYEYKILTIPGRSPPSHRPRKKRMATKPAKFWTRPLRAVTKPQAATMNGSHRLGFTFFRIQFDAVECSG